MLRIGNTFKISGRFLVWLNYSVYVCVYIIYQSLLLGKEQRTLLEMKEGAEFLHPNNRVVAI